MAQGTTQIIIALFCSLFISSAIIAWFVLQIYGATISGVSLPSGLETFSSNQNFVNGSYDTSTLKILLPSSWKYENGVGVIKQGSTNVGTIGLNPNDYFAIMNIQPNNGIITNYYTINNAPKNDFGFVFRHFGNSGRNVIVKSDGYHIYWNLPYSEYPTADEVFVASPNANQITQGNFKTVYDDNKNTISLYKDNVLIITDDKIPADDGKGVFGAYYGGVICPYDGFIIENFRTDNIIQNSGEASKDPILLTWSLVQTLLQIMFWNIDEKYLPLLLNLLLIKTQLAGLLIAIAAFLRGV